MGGHPSRSGSTMSRAENRTDDVILDVDGVNVRFDMDRGTSRVLRDVEMDINREEMIGIVGESGSGKSMFASAMLDAVVEPSVTTGRITYHPSDGEPVDVLSLSDEELENRRWEDISMVFQGAMNSFNPTMKIRGHFKETARAHDYDVDERLAHGRQLLSDLYLDPERVFDSYPHELSGGMKQRALIALSLVLEPEVLVMDEPTAALDLLMQRSIINLLDNLQEKYELTVVFITHDLPLVAGLVDRVAVMYAFQFVEVGPTRDVLKRAGHPYTRALLRSAPSLDTPIDQMQTVEGESPDPVDAPQGCSYHPRCPFATRKCETTDPPYHEVNADHDVACFYWEESIQGIEYSLGTGATNISGYEELDDGPFSNHGTNAEGD